MAASNPAQASSHASAPPPLPNEPMPEDEDGNDVVDGGAGSSLPVDQPIRSLGDDDDDEESEDEGSDEDEEAGSEARKVGDATEEQEDPASGVSAKSSKKSKGKGKAPPATNASQPWQAVWSAERNAWYFWNTVTSEVTWTNPLQPESSTSSAPAQPPLPPGPPPESTTQPSASFGMPADIDPDLAYLLPPSQRGGSGAQSSAQTALFNSRTGRFTPADYSYSVDHLDEYNRSKRMNSHYFDVDAWEKQRAAENAKRKRDAEAGVEPAKVTRKDMQRYKKKAQEKKMRREAWLRE